MDFVNRIGTCVAGLFLVSLAAAQPADTPTPSQVLGGQALNELLQKCKDLPASKSPEPPAALPEKARDAINILAPSGVDTAPFLRVGTIAWPAAFEDVRSERKCLIQAITTARNEAAKGKVNEKTTQEIRQVVEKLKKHLANRIEDITPTLYIEAKRLMIRLEPAVKAVNAPSLGKDLALAEQTAKIKTTADLVRWMNEKKLKFAPSLPGQQEAYQELHRALVEHHRKAAALRK
jgi:hypothetical protein